MSDEPITRAFLRIIAETDERVELPSPRLIELLDAEAERDRLRAVVEADRRFLNLDPNLALDDPTVDEAWAAYKAAHRALDGYEVPTEEGT